MNTIVLIADTANGVQEIDMVDFMTENPDQEFVDASHFIDYLDSLEDGETVAAVFVPLEHEEYLQLIREEYGTH